ncbi:capsular polysaccharide biosynthesis protein [Marivita sp. S6314]|uniref:capsular polysaccharide biosynthesis protein n=1 Tax=Marivita sp. S6314 TaxID=2926406 RepID=UPI001FF15F14|nr:capsular polysaccharide biosynthesis protein [Marivita sp. S6314]
MYNSGFLTQTRIKRILSLSGWSVSVGRPSEGDWIGVWGATPSASRGVSVADKTDSPVLRVEDAFLRSLHPGRVGREPPLGLLLDRTGLHFDASRPSGIETHLIESPLDDTALLDEARGLIARLRTLKLSKYCAYDPDLPLLEPGYVLVIDQAEGDASVQASVPGVDTARARFAEMLYYAQTEHPAARILIKSHPETTSGKRGGHYTDAHLSDRIAFVEGDYAPYDLLEGAIAVYTLSSQMGFEAILAGHKPRVFGTPCYAGWGLTEDEHSFPRRQRKLTRAQLFAGAMIQFPVWYDPFDDVLCGLERVVDTLEATQRTWIEDRHGWIASNISLWKRPHMQAMFGAHVPMRFGSSDTDGHRRKMAWGSSHTADWSVEDGFLRSNGLGAELVPPVSLALDDLGIYYDPTRPSHLETLISKSAKLSAQDIRRARRLIDALVEHGITKYATGLSDDTLPDVQGRTVLLVPGQVEDDASVRLGSPDIKTNAVLLEHVRRANPDAFIIYKPHPDVQANLRPGKVAHAETWADLVVEDVPMASLLGHVDAVWTLTSLTGFEALLRGASVTTLGIPFYAGWGLTADLCAMPERRNTPVTLEGLAHAALIGYPRYHDPVTNAACPVEVALDRLVSGRTAQSKRLRILAKAQGLLSGYAWLWRR